MNGETYDNLLAWKYSAFDGRVLNGSLQHGFVEMMPALFARDPIGK